MEINKGNNLKLWVNSQHQQNMDQKTKSQVHKYKQHEATWEPIRVEVKKNQRQVHVVTVQE